MLLRVLVTAIAAAVPLATASLAHATLCVDPAPGDPTGSFLASTAFRDATNPTLAMTSTIQFADVDGDGQDDLCGHDGTRIVCYTHVNDDICVNGICTTVPDPCYGFGNHTFTASFDASWLSSPAYYQTFRFPDLNDDGRADVCGRGSAGVICALSNGSNFNAPTIWAPVFSNANGWNAAQYYQTLAFPDVDGDGRADVCGRGGAGLYCGRSTGTGFTNPSLQTTSFRDADGWGGSESYYGTIRFADIDDDGDDDVCGRGGAGVYCARSNPVLQSFSAATLWTTQFSDAAGWTAPQYYKTIQLADVNGDHAFDLCGRGGAGVYCGISFGATQDVFTGADVIVDASSYSDANGWNVDHHYRTIRVVDANGDGRADVCGRGGTHVMCQLAKPFFTQAQNNWNNLFDPPVAWVANFGNNAGWNANEKYWGTVQPTDAVDDWSGAEFCGRGTDGIWCSYR